jgi:hypothetical protein
LRLAAGEVSLGDLARETLKSTKSYAALNFWSFWFKPKGQEKKGCLEYLKLGVPKVFVGCQTFSVARSAVFLFTDEKFEGQ